ncbi:MAG: glycoside hydrolase family 52 protein [Planctomycetota bacterium]
MPMFDPTFVNTFHSPIGAHCSLTLGMPANEKKTHGGLGVQLGKPADEDVFIGVQSADDENLIQALPFFVADESTGSEDFVDSDLGMDDHYMGDLPGVRVEAFTPDQIVRRLDVGSDVWTVGDLTVRIDSPVRTLPDPHAKTPDHDALKLATCPAVTIELTVDNTKGAAPRVVFLGYAGHDASEKMRQFDRPDDRELGVVGIARGFTRGFASADPRVVSGQAFSLAALVKPVNPQNRRFALGPVAALTAEVPAGARETFRFAAVFYTPGVVTSGQNCAYFYTRYFDRLETVAKYALDHFDDYRGWADDADRWLARADTLNPAQRFQLVHTIRSYYGSTEFLDRLDASRHAVPLSHDGRTPMWVVNEGEYRMLNTFDLAVDMLFYELRMHPWTVRDVLEHYVERYSYEDQVRFPGDDTLHPGGVSFTHDHGANNHFSPPHYSSYEASGIRGCFSYMTHEQLLNFICTAGTYLHHTGDTAWRDKHAGLWERLLTSCENRDHPEPSKRNGVMSLDSSRCDGGAEITTYDSLDTSLGQARNNGYMAVKGWASYLLLEKVFRDRGEDALAERAAAQAKRAADTLVANVGGDGTLPALLNEEAGESRIISVIEGLVFPQRGGREDALAADGPFAALLAALRTHTEKVLQPGVCRFDDGAWKLSSTSINSWLSKIYLSQHVARAILGVELDPTADDAHAAWLCRPGNNAYWAWSDQHHSGVAKGSKYYPRGVTTALWLDEAGVHDAPG